MEIEKEISSLMTEERLLHVKETKRIAFEIAGFYNVEVEKLELACLFHDIAKDIPKDKMKSLIEKHRIILDEIEKREIGLWHGIIGEEIVKERFNIKDLEILEAIKFHSTGKANMSLLFSLLYIADYLETCPSDEIKEKAKKNIQDALKMVVAKKIGYVLKKGSLLHPRSIELWNSIVRIQNPVLCNYVSKNNSKKGS